MSPATLAAISALVAADATISVPERADIMSVVSGQPTREARMIKFNAAAKRLGVCPRTVMNLVSRKVIRGIKPPGSTRMLGVAEQDIENLITGRVQA
jgi:hypothetical protein